MNRKPETIRFYRKRLPHWEVRNGLYFVTIRQSGSIPRDELESLIALSKTFEGNHGIEYQQKKFITLENLLDNNGNGNLTEKAYSEIISDAIKYRNHLEKWRMIEYVIMPNHIHLFFNANGNNLSGLIKDFKRWTTTEFKKLGDAKEVRWQREWFDHWSRSDVKDERIIKYIRDNPVKAGFVNQYQDWRYGSWSK